MCSLWSRRAACFALSAVLSIGALAACAAGPPAGEPGAAPAASAVLAAELVAGPELGRAIFAGEVPIVDFVACTTCHSVDPAAPAGVGPNLSGVALAAAVRVPGQDAPIYLERSIRAHDEYVVEGYTAGVARAVVGRDFGEVLSDEQVAALVAYLLTLSEPAGGVLPRGPVVSPTAALSADSADAADSSLRRSDDGPETCPGAPACGETGVALVAAAQGGPSPAGSATAGPSVTPAEPSPTAQLSVTPAPASATAVPASVTPAPASATAVPASATAVPASVTAVPASALPVQPSATPQPAAPSPLPAPSATPPPPSATPPPAPTPAPPPPPPSATPAPPTAVAPAPTLPSLPDDPDLARYAGCVTCHDQHPLQVQMPHPLNPSCNDCHRGSPNRIGCPTCHSTHGIDNRHEPRPDLACASCHT